MHCPQFSGCATRLKGSYCPDTDKEEFSRLIDSDGHFDPAHFGHAKLCGKGDNAACRQIGRAAAKTGQDH